MAAPFSPSRRGGSPPRATRLRLPPASESPPGRQEPCPTLRCLLSRPAAPTLGNRRFSSAQRGPPGPRPEAPGGPPGPCPRRPPCQALPGPPCQAPAAFQRGTSCIVRKRTIKPRDRLRALWALTGPPSAPTRIRNLTRSPSSTSKPISWQAAGGPRSTRTSPVDCRSGITSRARSASSPSSWCSETATTMPSSVLKEYRRAAASAWVAQSSAAETTPHQRAPR